MEDSSPALCNIPHPPPTAPPPQALLLAELRLRRVLSDSRTGQEGGAHQLAGLGHPALPGLGYSICKMEEVIGISKNVMDFCQQRGIDDRRAYLAALCTEEMASNIVQHGFAPDAPQSLMIRVVVANGDLILRFRDNCKLFNIREKYDSADQKDVTSNIGIRIVMRMAKDVMYVNTLKLNTTIIKI